MSDQLVSDGRYYVLAARSLDVLTMDEGIPEIGIRGGRGDAGELWTLASGPDGITLRNEATGRYLGADGDPTQVQSTINGTDKPFAWKLSLDDTGLQPCYVLASAASGDRLVLSLRGDYTPANGYNIVAISPPGDIERDGWRFYEVSSSDIGIFPQSLRGEGF